MEKEKKRKVKKQDKSGKGRKILLRCIVMLVVLLILAVAVFVALVFIQKWKLMDSASVENSEENIEQYFEDLEEEYDEISFDEKKGVAFINNEVIIMAAKGVGSQLIAGIIDEYGGVVVDSMQDIGFYKVKFDDEYTLKELENLIEELIEFEDIDDAYVNPILNLTDDTEKVSGVEGKKPGYPKDPWNNASWNIDVPRDENWGVEAIRAPKAWGYFDELSMVRIGLIDTMINTDHEDLFGTCYLSLTDTSSGASSTQLVTPKNLTPMDHGSHVAGIMAAKWNDKGISGVLGDKADLYYSAAYNVKNGSLVDEYYDAFNYVKAIKVLVDNDVQCINISQNTCRLIGFAASKGNKNAIRHLETQASLAGSMLARMVENIEAGQGNDFVICVAAGNSNNIVYYESDTATYGYVEGKDADFITKVFSGEKGGSQALYNNFLNLIDEESVKNRIIVVGSVGIDSKKSTKKETRYKYSKFSNIGERVDIVAPGENIYSCYVKGYGYNSGTSMATPFVTAVSGMVFAANPELSGPEVKSIVCASTYGRYYFENGSAGLLDASMAVNYALETVDHSVGRVLKQTTTDGLDLCFMVDTTGSMDDDIANTQTNMEKILASLTEKNVEYRIAIVDYRDFAERTGDRNDYPAKVQLDFCDDSNRITSAINNLTLGYGGDTEETVYSGFATALGLAWRPTAKKVIIVLGDAPPLDPEPYTGYTYDNVVASLYDAKIGIDMERSDDRVLGEAEESLVNVYTIGTEASSDAMDFFESIADATGGSYMDVADASEVSGAIVESIELIEIVEPINVTLSFGNEYANDTVEIYRDGEFLYEFALNETGNFKLENMEADSYEWKIPKLEMSGEFKVKEGTKKVKAEGEQPWYGFALKIWYKNRVELILGSIAVVVVLIAVGVIRKKVKKSKKTKELQKTNEVPKVEATQKKETVQKTEMAQKTEVTQTTEATQKTEEAKVAEGQNFAKEPEMAFCFNCGTPIKPNAKFCRVCGTKLE